MANKPNNASVMLTVKSLSISPEVENILKKGLKGKINITGFTFEKGFFDDLRKKFKQIPNIKVKVGAEFKQSDIITAWNNAKKGLKLSLGDVGLNINKGDVKKIQDEMARVTKGSGSKGGGTLFASASNDLKLIQNTMNKVKKQFGNEFTSQFDAKSVIRGSGQELEKFTINIKNAKGEVKALNFAVQDGARGQKTAYATTIRELNKQEEQTKKLIKLRAQLRKEIESAVNAGKLSKLDSGDLMRNVNKAKTVEAIQSLQQLVKAEQNEHMQYKKMAEEKFKIINKLREAQIKYGESASVKGVGRLNDANIEAFENKLFSISGRQRPKAREMIQDINREIVTLGQNNGFKNAETRLRALKHEAEGVNVQIKALNGNAKNAVMDDVFKRLSEGARVSSKDVRDVIAQLRLMKQERDRLKASIGSGEKDTRMTNDLKGIGYNLQNSQSVQTAVGQMAKNLPQGQVYSFRKSVNDLNQTVYEFSTKTMDKMNNSWKISRYQMNGMTGDVNKLGETMQRLSNRDLSQVQQMMVAIGRTMTWGLATTAIYGTQNAIARMYEEILKVDQAMTELKRVLPASTDFESMLDGAIEKANELGNTLAEVMEIQTNFAKQGYDGKELEAMTEASQIFNNISDLNATESSEYLTAITKAYGIAEEQVIRVVDAINQVDNNFSVSSKQLAEGLAKVAGSAVATGVSMDTVIGQITAIGQVTRESGSTIGRSLKTIFTRTLSDKAEKQLTAVGVATRNAGGEFLKVEDILASLSGKWDTLNTEQQNNVSMAIAGRDHIARFNILMQQQGTTIDASKTAMDSYGSAIVENMNFQKSLEARQNRLKNAFTEMSLALGEAFLTPAFINAVEVLGQIFRMFGAIVDKVGLLPAVLAPVGMALAVWWQVTNKTSINFIEIAKRTVAWISTLGTANQSLLANLSVMQRMTVEQTKQQMLAKRGLAESSASAVSNNTVVAGSRLNKQALTLDTANATRSAGQATASINAVNASMSTAGQTASRTSGFFGRLTTAFASAGVAGTALAGALRLIGSTLGIGLLITGVTIVIEKLVSKMSEAKQKQQEFESTMSAMGQTLNQNKADVENYTQTYYSLSEKTNLTIEETDRLAEAKKNLAGMFPNLITGYDSEGDAILANNKVMKDSIAVIEQYTKAKQMERAVKISDDIKKEKENVSDLKKQLSDLEKQRADLQDGVGKKAGEKAGAEFWESDEMQKKLLDEIGKKRVELNNKSLEIATTQQKIKALQQEELVLSVQTNKEYQKMNTESQNILVSATQKSKLSAKEAEILKGSTSSISKMSKLMSGISGKDFSTQSFVSAGKAQRQDMISQINLTKENIQKERNVLKAKIDSGKASKSQAIQYKVLGTTLEEVSGLTKSFASALQATNTSQDEITEATGEYAQEVEVESELLGRVVPQKQLYYEITKSITSGTIENALRVSELTSEYFELVNQTEQTAGSQLRMIEITRELGLAEGYTQAQIYERMKAMDALAGAHNMLQQIEVAYANKSMDASQKATYVELQNASAIVQALQAKIDAYQVAIDKAEEMFYADQNANWEDAAVQGAKFYGKQQEAVADLSREMGMLEQATVSAGQVFPDIQVPNYQQGQGGSATEAIKKQAEATEKQAEAEEKKAKKEKKAKEEQEKAIFIANKYELALAKINTQYSKMNKEMAKFPQWSKQYREGISDRIKLLNKEVSLLKKQREEIKKQVKSGKLVSYGVSETGYQTVSNYAPTYTSNGKASYTSTSKLGGGSSSYSKSFLKGKLAGRESQFAKYGSKYNVDPALAMAIAMWETGNGSSKMLRQKNNVGGMYDSRNKTFFKFPSVEAGIESMIRNLHKNYTSQGLKTIAQIQKKYAPSGAGNDPNGLNNHWTKGVTSMYNKAKGSSGSYQYKTVGGSSSGGGLKKTGNRYLAGWNGVVTGAFGEPRSWGRHEGTDIDGYNGQRLDSNVNGTVIHAGGANRSLGIPPEYGNCVVIKSGSYYHIYAHLKKITCKKGKIAIGQQIGQIGHTGNVISSTGDGSHLHYEVRSKMGRWGQNLVNPNSMASKAKGKQTTYTYGGGSGGGGNGVMVGEGATEKANSQEALYNAKNDIEGKTQEIYDKEAERYQLMMEWLESLSSELERNISKKQVKVDRAKGKLDLYTVGYDHWNKLQTDVINGTKGVLAEQKKAMAKLVKQRKRKDLTPAMKAFLDDTMSDLKTAMEESTRNIYAEYFARLNGYLEKNSREKSKEEAYKSINQTQAGLYSNDSEKFRKETTQARNNVKDMANLEKKRLAYLEKEYKSKGKYSGAQKSQIADMIRESKVNLESYRAEMTELWNTVFNSSLASFDKKIENRLREQTNKIRTYDTKMGRLDQTDKSQYLKDLTPLIAKKDTALTAQIKAQAEAVAKYRKELKKLKAGTPVYDELVQKIRDAEQALLDMKDAQYENKKALKDAQKEATASVVESMKQVFENMRDGELKALDTVQKAREKKYKEAVEKLDNMMEVEEKASAKRLEAIDKQREAYNKMVDDKIKGMERQKAEESHTKSMTKLYEQEAELKNKIAVLGLDDSFDAKKKREDLKKELKDIQEQIGETQSQWDYDKQVEAINDGRDKENEKYDDRIEAENKYMEALRESVEAQKKALDEEMDKFNEIMDEKREAINKYYDDIANNTKLWNEIQEDVAKGNFTKINEMIKKLNSGASDAFRSLLGQYPEDFKNLSTSLEGVIKNLGTVLKDNILFNISELEKLMASLSASIDKNKGTTPADIKPTANAKSLSIPSQTALVSGLTRVDIPQADLNSGNSFQFGNITMSFPDVTNSANVPDIMAKIMEELRVKYGISF